MPEVNVTVSVSSRDFATGAALGKFNAVFAAVAELVGNSDGGSSAQLVLDVVAPLEDPLNLVSAVTVTTLDIPKTVNDTLESVVVIGSDVRTAKIFLVNKSAVDQNIVFKSTRKFQNLGSVPFIVDGNWQVAATVSARTCAVFDITFSTDFGLISNSFNGDVFVQLGWPVITAPIADPTNSGTVLASLWSDPILLNLSVPAAAEAGDFLNLGGYSTDYAVNASYCLTDDDIATGSANVPVSLHQGQTYTLAVKPSPVGQTYNIDMGDPTTTLVIAGA